MLLKRWKLLLEVMADNTLHASSYRVMTFMLNRENSKTKALFPSHKRLAKDTNLSERSVRRGVDSLIVNNYLIKIKRGGPGVSTRYAINYKQRTIMSKLEDNNDRNIRTDMTDKSTNKSTNESRVKINHAVNRLAKNLNGNYKAVKEGKRKAFNSNDEVYARILKKTGSFEKAQAYLDLKNSADFNDKTKAEDFAKYLGCLK